MENYLPALSGGIMIGIAALLMLLFLGRITGISGIIWSALSSPLDSLWRWSFLAGLIIGPLLYHYVGQVAIPHTNNTHWSLAMLAGLVVGVGVKLGSGCTSGHGVCGIGRLSIRSIVATLTFMVCGILTVLIMRHIL